MIFLEIVFCIFIYFLFLWGFRIIIGVLLFRIAVQLKSKIEKELKEKVENVKRSVKESGGTGENL